MKRMSIIKELENDVKKAVHAAGYDTDNIIFVPSVREDLGDYQLNDAMSLAKKYGESPQAIASKIVMELEKDHRFTKINIAGPGFINITLSDDFLLDSMNKLLKDVYHNIDRVSGKKIIMDYGGANIAKTLHVGHLRSANIGEAVKRLATLLGHEVISDVHFGDIGRQSGMVISEIKERYPDLPYFDEAYTGNYEEVEFNITEQELGEIYPLASTKAKEDETKMEEVVTITKELEEGHRGYTALWNKIKEVSIKDITKVYERLNTKFDLLEGESDCYPYIKETLDIIEQSGLLQESEGAKIVEVKTEEDDSPMPPLVVMKSNGATLYATRDLATIHSRMKRFSPSEIWYFADNRQALYFEQVFRTSYLTGLVDKKINLEFSGFGTMTGKDGKPFKTRDGGVMTLKDLIEKVKEETLKRINQDIVLEHQKDETAEMIAIAALKYADFLPFRTKDYVFDPIKFTDLEGKTGPYLLYSTVRMKSLLEKSGIEEVSFHKLKGTTDRLLALTILKLPRILTKSLEVKSLNEIAEYLYKLTSTYNTFYADNKVLKEQDEALKQSWLALTKLTWTINNLLLNTLGIKVPEKM